MQRRGLGRDAAAVRVRDDAAIGLAIALRGSLNRQRGGVCTGGGGIIFIILVAIIVIWLLAKK